LAHALGRIPHRGDFCLHKDLRIEVMRADSRRALWLRVKRRLLNDSTTPAKVD
jgi:magnesium and cobalt transporter